MTEPILTREQYEAAEREYGYDRDTDIAQRAFADGWEAALAVLEKVCGEPIYQTRWDFPRLVWGDVPKADYDTYLDHGYADRRIVYALTRSKP
ncbi:hypothetical protein [Burkholderia ambifaria]|uniref:hypothetical protein n=1 Tax=Burkholderia ambifaria TaxID=152480 RepID=UPI001B9BBBB1|nr:hypothetical protein [Burkholderia ambifaria]MBR8221258.1 hypothetical protein [Burkholderia ambifaria]